MVPKLGSRYFPIDRILAEIRWGRDHGATQIHFVEANLNLVSVFWPLMRALEDLNADGALTLYAELRGEHLTDESVAALARAGLRVAEVGLQTANLAALKVAHRKTNLQKWAAGTRRLAQRGIEIYLMDAGETPPFGAWAAAGRAGVWLRGAPAEETAAWRQWEQTTGRRVWGAID